MKLSEAGEAPNLTDMGGTYHIVDCGRKSGSHRAGKAQQTMAG